MPNFENINEINNLEKPKNLQTIVLGGGCFWCTEAVFKSIAGVSAVESGYIGGAIADPTYKQAFVIGLFQSIAIIPGVSRSAAPCCARSPRRPCATACVGARQLRAAELAAAHRPQDQLVAGGRKLQEDRLGPQATVATVLAQLVGLALVMLVLAGWAFSRRDYGAPLWA